MDCVEYLYFCSENGINGLFLSWSNEPVAAISSLLSSFYLRRKLRQRFFVEVIKPFLTECQKIVCSDGVFQIVWRPEFERYLVVPVRFNRELYWELSHHLRLCRRKGRLRLRALDFSWMDLHKLQLTRRIVLELFDACNFDTTELDSLISLRLLESSKTFQVS